MDHALVVIEAEYDPTDLVREAGELAAGVDAELTLLYVTTEDEYRQKRETLAQYAANEDTRYKLDDAIRGAKTFVEDLASTALSDIDVTPNTAASFGALDDETLAYARENDVDHIFIAGKKRSPIGKAVFGDEAQSVILDFDGATTIVTQ